MGEAVKQLSIEDNNSHKEKKQIKESIFDTHTEELIIGLCAPIGTDIKLVADRIEDTLTNQYQYKCLRIKLSRVIETLQDTSSHTNEYERYIELINQGNDLRSRYGTGVLAELAINEITVNRESIKKGKEYEGQRVCYIIDSIKNTEELELFRLIYSDLFYFFGVFSPVDLRIRNLKNKGLTPEQIHKLIDRDSNEETEFGQKVTETFTSSDFFMRVEDNSPLIIDPKINRFLNLIFNTNVITPTKDETAMYLASSAAGNSACLSRQVGASITDKEGEVLSVGWNDVPKAGGSVYRFDIDNPQNDKRCINRGRGYCSNDFEKKKITEELVEDLLSNGLINANQKDKFVDAIMKTRIRELIEFSRAVHAEMLAIINGSQKAGDRIIGGNLYCTTYPCHNCARHIIAAGIKNVFYIEPYSKSLATKLHDDSITEDESKTELVRILMYDGVSPRRYLHFFRMNGKKRKKDGYKLSIPPNEAEPKKTLSLQAIPILEGKVTEELLLKKLITKGEDS